MMQEDDVSEEAFQANADAVIAAYSIPAPFPVIWWDTEVDRQGRRRCRRIHSNVYTTASKALRTYAATFQVHMVEENRILDVAKDGTLFLNREVTLLDMVNSHHQAFMDRNGLSPIMRDRQLGDVDLQLVSWYLVWGWFAGMFKTSVFRSANDESTFLQTTRPDYDAMCYADVAMLMLERRDSPLPAYLCAEALTITRQDTWGSPPWNFK